MQDSIKWWPQITVQKFDSVPDTMRDLGLDHEPTGQELVALGVAPDRVLEAEGNFLTNVGRTRIADLLIGNGTPNQLNAAKGLTGVGDSSANGDISSVQGQTALQAASNRLYNPLSGAPGDSSPGVITASSNYDTGDANFAWNEWGLFIASGTPAKSATYATAVGTGIMLNRAVQSLGTKVSTAVWVLQVTVTIS